jgi:hypothetical protein
MSPLVTVRGGGPEQAAPCQARSHHGYSRRRARVVLAMRSWVKTGTVPADVGNELIQP